MKRINRWLGAAALAAAMLSVSGGNLLAQGQGRGNFDPAQFRERMMERYREQLEVKDDTDWKALEPLIQKVMDARMQTMAGMGRGMFGGGGGRRGGGQGGDNASADNNNSGGQRRGPFSQEPSPEAAALQKAIDAKASNSELKAALAKYTAARKDKQAELEKAQSDLQAVLSVRQEAIASTLGLL